MAKIGTIKFKGASGEEYHFNIYPIAAKFNEVGAVYVITQGHEDGPGSISHQVIYIGQTDDLSERFDDHHDAACFRRNNANCICVHQQKDEQRRLAIERDLINNYNPPCND